MSVTLRGDRKWEFLDRLLNVALPRVRDFSGVSPKAFDGRGNYTLGIREQTIFQEVDYDAIEKVKGMNITLVHDGQDGRGGQGAAGAPRRSVPGVGEIIHGSEAARTPRRTVRGLWSRDHDDRPFG